MALLDFLLEKVKPEYQALLKQVGVVFYNVSFALRKEYMGRQLMYRALSLVESLGVKKGYSYSFGYASNFRSAQTAIKLGYEKIASCECRDFEHNGVKPFALVDELHHETSLWLRKLA